MIRVLLCDDQALVRTGLALILGQYDDIEVVGQAGDGAEAGEAAGRLRPDVVLMDVQMPRVDGIEGTRRIAARCPEVAVLILTTYDLDEYVLDALRLGAAGYLLKDSPPAALVAAIRAAAAGDVPLSREIARRLAVARPAAVDPALTAALDTLTPREREVLLLVAEGLTNAEIAGRIIVAESTVKTHVANLLAKLAARDRIALAVLVHRHTVRSGTA